MGMLRTVIVLGAVVAAMPSPPEDSAVAGSQSPGQGYGQGPGPFAYLAAATGAFTDVKAFCTRQPYVCETASHFAYAVERKARYSATLFYEWANEATSNGKGAPLPANMALTDLINTI